MEIYKEKKRERRIRDRLRMIDKGRRYYKENWISNYWRPEDYKFLEHQAMMHGRRYHDNLCLCSCDICGNQRHSGWNKNKDRITLQEYKALIDEKEQKDEWRCIWSNRKPN